MAERPSVRALAVGSAMIDTIAIIDSGLIEHLTLRNAETSFLLLEAGRKTEALDVSTHCGGGGLNVAVALARLGLATKALLKLGDDARADTICRHLNDEGVAIDWVLRDARQPTGAAVHLSSHDRDAAIFTYRGANTLLEPDDVPEAAFDTDLVYVSSLSEGSAACFPPIISAARNNGAIIASNPGIRQLSAKTGAFLRCLDKIDILTLNRVEADALVPALASRAAGDQSSLQPAPGDAAPALVVRGFAGGGIALAFATFFKTVLDLGPRYLVVTDGAAGAFIGSHDGVFHCPVVASEVAGTAGAGDAFAATFAAMIALGENAENAAQAAAINAASVVTRIDAEGGLLTRDAIEQRLASTSSQPIPTTWRFG